MSKKIEELTISDTQVIQQFVDNFTSIIEGAYDLRTVQDYWKETIDELRELEIIE